MPRDIVRVLMESYTDSEGFTFKFVSKEKKQDWISNRTQIPIAASYTDSEGFTFNFVSEENKQAWISDRTQVPSGDSYTDSE